MSLQSQIANMKALAALLSNDLGYIFGERECGPNGEKKAFLSRGAAFLRALGKDLGLSVHKVRTNKAGIAVSGEVYLDGMWETNGLHICLEQMFDKNVLLYRTITAFNDNHYSRNHFITLDELRRADYAGLVLKLLDLKENTTAKIAA
jgi:hypothetical protein